MPIQEFRRLQWAGIGPVTEGSVRACFDKIYESDNLRGLVMNGFDEFPAELTLGKRTVKVIRDRILPSGVFEFLLNV